MDKQRHTRVSIFSLPEEAKNTNNSSSSAILACDLLKTPPIGKTISSKQKIDESDEKAQGNIGKQRVSLTSSSASSSPPPPAQSCFSDTLTSSSSGDTSLSGYTEMSFPVPFATLHKSPSQPNASSDSSSVPFASSSTGVYATSASRSKADINVHPEKLWSRNISSAAVLFDGAASYFFSYKKSDVPKANPAYFQDMTWTTNFTGVSAVPRNATKSPADVQPPYVYPTLTRDGSLPRVNKEERKNQASWVLDFVHSYPINQALLRNSSRKTTTKDDTKNLSLLHQQFNRKCEPFSSIGMLFPSHLQSNFSGQHGSDPPYCWFNGYGYCQRFDLSDIVTQLQVHIYTTKVITGYLSSDGSEQKQLLKGTDSCHGKIPFGSVSTATQKNKEGASANIISYGSIDHLHPLVESIQKSGDGWWRIRTTHKGEFRYIHLRDHLHDNKHTKIVVSPTWKRSSDSASPSLPVTKGKKCKYKGLGGISNTITNCNKSAGFFFGHYFVLGGDFDCQYHHGGHHHHKCPIWYCKKHHRPY